MEFCNFCFLNFRVNEVIQRVSDIRAIVEIIHLQNKKIMKEISDFGGGF